LVSIGLIGYGYWGPNLARNIGASKTCRLAAIADPAPLCLAAAGRTHPGVTLLPNGGDLIADPYIDAVVVATPAQSHFELAMAALRAGKHVLVEKPLARTSDQALALIEESQRRGLVLMVDHTYVFSPAIGKIAETVQSGGLGDLQRWDSARLNLGLVRNDVNVVWDLAAHDFGILDHVLSAPPSALRATGVRPDGADAEHLAEVTLDFPGGLIAHITVSWISPIKVRRTLITGSRGTLVYDDQRADALTIHERAVPLDAAEPLSRAIDHFAGCVSRHERPMVDGEAGLRVIRLLEAADQSLRRSGQVVSLDADRVVV
jgi:predicted dehydrogenase